MLKHFYWYRRLRGGAWARVTGYVWGYRWVRLPPGQENHADEIFL